MLERIKGNHLLLYFFLSPWIRHQIDERKSFCPGQWSIDKRKLFYPGC